MEKKIEDPKPIAEKYKNLKRKYTSLLKVLIFNKGKKENKNVLFIDASKEFRNAKNQNFLDAVHLKKIMETFSFSLSTFYNFIFDKKNFYYFIF